MNSTSNDQDLFKVWATDGMVYGPVELPVLIQWVREGRAQADIRVTGGAIDLVPVQHHSDDCCLPAFTSVLSWNSSVGCGKGPG